MNKLTRAQRAANVLSERGWDISDNSGKICPVCKSDTVPKASYCAFCGTKLLFHKDTVLADLEAAIAAGVDHDA